MPFLLYKGDINGMDVDAAVSVINEGSSSGSGAAADSESKTAGTDPEREIDGSIGCEPGEAVLEEADGRPGKYLIRTAVPEWHGGQEGEAALLASCYRRALQLAADKGCASAAFPLLAAGENGFPHDLSINTASGVIVDFLQDHDLTVYLVLDNKDDLAGDDPLLKEFEWGHAMNEFIDFGMQANGYGPMDLESGMLDGPGCEETNEAAGYYCVKYRVCVEHDILSRLKDSMSVLEKKILPVLKLTSAAEILDSDSPEARRAFLQMLDDYLGKRGLSDETCCRKANLNSQTLADLRRDSHFQLSYPTALALTFALELSVEESKALLAKAGYTLMRSNFFEFAAEFFLTKKIYDVHRVNRYLFSFGYCQLGMQY